MRRNLTADANQFPRDVVELLEYFLATAPGQALQAVPGAGEAVEVWILGSSTFGAQLAAVLGLPYAFASHFAPEQMQEAIAVYRAQFRPSERLAAPHVMLGVNVFAAETDAQARAVVLVASAGVPEHAPRTARQATGPDPRSGRSA